MVDIFEPLSEEEIEHLNGQLQTPSGERRDLLRPPEPLREALHPPERQGQDLQVHPGWARVHPRRGGSGTVFEEMALWSAPDAKRGSGLADAWGYPCGSRSTSGRKGERNPGAKGGRLSSVNLLDSYE